jgi:hypothetical protein
MDEYKLDSTHRREISLCFIYHGSMTMAAISIDHIDEEKILEIRCRMFHE